MLKLQETTQWNDNTRNHVYFVDDSKTTLFGYITAGSQKEQWFDGKRSFDAKGRKFTVLAKLPDPVSSSVKTWSVAGSKGASYSVTLENNTWTCTCPAFAYKAGDCKHIKSVRQDTNQ